MAALRIVRSWSTRPKKDPSRRVRPRDPSAEGPSEDASGPQICVIMESYSSDPRRRVWHRRPGETLFRRAYTPDALQSETTPTRKIIPVVVEEP